MVKKWELAPLPFLYPNKRSRIENFDSENADGASLDWRTGGDRVIFKSGWIGGDERITPPAFSGEMAEWSKALPC